MPDFLRRSYHEIVRDSLTRLIGGVAGESIVFSEEANQEGFFLEMHPVAEVLRVAAQVGDEIIDLPLDEVELIADRSRLSFKGAFALADNTPLFVDYYPVGAGSPITDVHTGGVARTLVETMAHELAFFYAKLQRVYRNAFVDTADGSSLDHVVALLGIQRILSGYPTVTLTFSRNTPAAGDITIPAGTIVSTGIRADGSEVRFITAATQVLKKGARTVDAPARASDESIATAVGIGPAELRVMPRPVVGIDRVINHTEVFHSTSDESDEALRLRAKMALQGAGKVTTDALRSAVLDQGGLAVVIRDMPRGAPGEVEMFVDLPDYDDEIQQRSHQDRILRAIDATRGAGVRVYTNFARKVYVSIGRVRAVLREGLAPTNREKEEIRLGVVRLLEAYVGKLTMGEKVTHSGLVAAALADERLRGVVLDDIETFHEDRLTRTPGGASAPQRVHDTATRLLDVSGVPLTQLGVEGRFDRIHLARDERAVLQLPRDIEIVTQAKRLVHAVIVDIEFSLVPVDTLVDRESLRERVTRQRIEPTVRAFFGELEEGSDVSLVEIQQLLDSRHYSLENAQLDALYARDQRVLIGVTSVPVAEDERAELGELRVR